MKILVPVLFALSTLSVAAPTLSLASATAAVACGPNATEAMKRPGGYCDQINSNNSIAPNGEGNGPACENVGDAGPILMRGVRTDVANIIYCCHYSEATMPTHIPAGLLPMTDETPLRAPRLATPCK